MAIELFWDDTEQTVILAEFSGKWTWDELHHMLATIQQLSEQRGQVFGAIIDLRNGMTVPGGSVFNREGLAQFRKLLAQNNGGGKGPMAIVGMNTMVRAIFDAVSSMDRKLTDDVFFADSIDDARRKIYSATAKLRQSAPAV